MEAFGLLPCSLQRGRGILLHGVQRFLLNDLRQRREAYQRGDDAGQAFEGRWVTTFRVIAGGNALLTTVIGGKLDENSLRVTALEPVG